MAKCCEEETGESVEEVGEEGIDKAYLLLKELELLKTLKEDHCLLTPGRKRKRRGRRVGGGQGALGKKEREERGKFTSRKHM